MRRPYPDGQPPSVRDFFAFEEHLLNARRSAGRGDVPDAWYEPPDRDLQQQRQEGAERVDAVLAISAPPRAACRPRP